MGRKIIRILSYVYMPILFMIVGYGILYIAIAPEIDVLRAAVSMVIDKEIPDINPTLAASYNSTEQAETLTEQTIISPTEIPKQVSIEEIEFPDVGTHFGRLTCERIGLDAPVYWGDSKAILKEGIGQFVGSFLPGFERSILLSGHNTTFFKSLQYLEAGDIIVCQTNYGIYEYQAMKLEVMKAEDAKHQLDDMLSVDSEELIMYTCYPFDQMIGNSADRLFVFGSKISGTRVEW